jgi:hypothetical protein
MHLMKAIEGESKKDRGCERKQTLRESVWEEKEEEHSFAVIFLPFLLPHAAAAANVSSESP